MKTATDLIDEILVAHGCKRVFGDPFGRLEHISLGEPTLASVLADADGRLNRVGVAFDATHRELRISSLVGGLEVATTACESPAHILRVIDEAARDVSRQHRTHIIHLDFDLDMPVSSRARPTGPRAYVPFAGAIVADTERVAVLAGPYVTRRAAAESIRSFAAYTNVGVANTWGAKGLFAWDSEYHMGTVGLQARDFELSFGACDVVIATGIDRNESRPAMPAGVRVTHVDPQQLEYLSVHVARRESVATTPLFDAISKIAQPGYSDERFPFHPARIVARLREQLPVGGLLAADPGTVGLWIARTFPTTELGSIVVPATGGPGIAAAIALCAALDGRQTIAAISERSDLHMEVVEFARHSALIIHESVWDESDTPADWSLETGLVDVAGPLVAF